MTEKSHGSYIRRNSPESAPIHKPSIRYEPWFVRKDPDGFFGLMIDNLIQLILIVSLCRELIHLPDSYIFGKILPVRRYLSWWAISFTSGKRGGSRRRRAEKT